MALVQSNMFGQHHLANDVMNNNLLQEASPFLFGPFQTQPQHQAVGRLVSSPAFTLAVNETQLLQRQRSTLPLTLTIGEHRKLDRSVSEPVRVPLNVNSSRYKTELCRPFEENGTCNYGDKCQFAHGAHELRNLPRHPKYKTELCKTFHNTAFCPYGLRCHFVHNVDERFSQQHRTLSNNSSPLSQSPTSSQMSFFSEGSLSPTPDSARQSPSPSFIFTGLTGINLDFRGSV